MKLLSFLPPAIACLILALALPLAATGQTADPSLIFAHNDYEQPVPFYTAHNLKVGYIEADVFLVGGELLVAHHYREIDPGKTLATLYLEPLSDAIAANGGNVYSEPQRKLTLMIDLKSEGPSTLHAIVALLQRYPQLLSCSTLSFLISGSVPPPDTWDEYPPFIHFDGRPGTPYTAKQLDRIAMISASFRDHVSWDGQGNIPVAAREKIRQLMATAHKQGKKFRFWATPDAVNAWKQFRAMNMDVIVTDNVPAVAAFLAK